MSDTLNPEEDCDIICIIKLINEITHGSRTYDKSNFQENLNEIEKWMEKHHALITTSVKKQHKIYPSPLMALIAADQLDYVKKLNVEWDDQHKRAIQKHINTLSNTLKNKEPIPLKDKKRILAWETFLDGFKPKPVKVRDPRAPYSERSKRSENQRKGQERIKQFRIRHEKIKKIHNKSGGKRKKKRGYKIKF